MVKFLKTCVVVIGLNVLFYSAKGQVVSQKKVDELLKQGSELLNRNLDSCSMIADKALDLSKEIRYPKGEMNALNLMGNIQQRKSNSQESEKYYLRSQEIAVKLNDKKGMAVSANNIAILLTERGDYPGALEKYQKALNLEAEIPDSSGMAEALNNIGVVYYYMGDLKKTSEYLEKAIIIEERTGNEPVLKKAYINLGAVFEYLKMYDKALMNYRKALKLSRKLNDMKETSICLHNIGGVYLEQGLLNNADSCFNAALKIKSELGDKKGMAISYTNIATLYLNRNDYENARNYYLKALDLSKATGDIETQKEVYRYLSDMYVILKDYKSALDQFKLFSDLRDTLLNKDRLRITGEMEVKYQTAEKDKQLLKESAKNARLEAENAEAELAVTHRNIWIGITGGLVLVVFFLSLIIIQRNRRKSQEMSHRQILEEREKGLKALIDATEIERRRIARDLHDGVGQQLSALKMGFQQINEQVSDEKIRHLKSLIDDAAGDVRSISHQMMPKVLEEFGLSAALEDLFAKSFGNGKIELRYQNKIGDLRFRPDVEIALYRVIQELINNILKHASASKVDVNLYSSLNQVNVLVQDNGSGFDMQQKQNGHGMSNIRTRIEAVGGVIIFESTIGSGSSAILHLPVN
jgi:signal transduction histidine kinase/Tfp pilus assembly protein PilF